MGTPVVSNPYKLSRFAHLGTDTIKVAILTDAYTVNQAHDFFDDVSASQVSGTGYTAGGATITGVTVALDGNTVEWIHDDIVWAQNAGGFTNGHTFVWYTDTGTPSTSRIIMFSTEAPGVNFGNVAGALTLDGSASTGVLNVT